MTTRDTAGADVAWTTDRIVAALVLLRAEAGNVSYGEIAVRIVRQREARGVSGAASRIARSTVYDVFRPDRNRLNPNLVAEVALALGVDEAQAQQWRQRCVQASRAASPPAQVERTTRSAEHTAELSPASMYPAAIPRLSAIVAIVALCIVTNIIGGELVILLPLPLYLDMIGTALAAIALGPWYGVAVGVLSHVFASLLHDSADGMPFVAVNVVGALLWGYGMRSWGLGKTPLRFLALSTIVAVACTLVAVPIIVYAQGGDSSLAGAALLAEKMSAVGVGMWWSVFSSNIITSILDKIIAGFIALSLAPVLLSQLGRPSGAGGVQGRYERVRHLRASAVYGVVREEISSPPMGYSAS